MRARLLRWTIAALSVGAIVFAGSKLLDGWEAGAVGNVKVHLLVPKLSEPSFVAISPDGTEVAALEPRASARVVTTAIELVNVASGSAGRVDMPKANWNGKGEGQFHLARPLRFCDGGKYLVAFDNLNHVYVFDARTLNLHTSFGLSAFQVVTADAGVPKTWGDVSSTRNLSFDCAANSSKASVRLEMNNASSIKLIDLELGSEIADVSAVFSTFWGHDVAISADGSLLAVDTWSRMKPQFTSVLEVADTKSKRLVLLRDTEKPGISGPEVAFAGPSHLLTSEICCTANWQMQRQAETGERRLTLIGLTNNATRNFGVNGSQVYRSFGSSVDGSEIFGYAAIEKQCKACNHGNGELKIKDAHFVVWSAVTGNLIVRSPRLEIPEYKCPWLTLGACENEEIVPQMQMSSGGKAAVVFWPGAAEDPRAANHSKLEVFTWR